MRWLLESGLKKDSSPATEALAHGAVGCPGPQPALPGEEPDPQMLFDGDVCLRLTHRRGGNARSQFDKANQLLRVIGKGNKERCVPLPQPVLDELRRLWLTHRNPRWLFPARFHSKHVGVDTLHTTFREVAEAAGIKGITAHCLRHSYATRLLENRFETRVGECPNFCVRSFCDGEFRFWLHLCLSGW